MLSSSNWYNWHATAPSLEQRGETDQFVVGEEREKGKEIEGREWRTRVEGRKNRGREKMMRQGGQLVPYQQVIFFI